MRRELHFPQSRLRLEGNLKGGLERKFLTISEKLVELGIESGIANFSSLIIKLV
jgi:hypothetical protein